MIKLFVLVAAAATVVIILLFRGKISGLMSREPPPKGVAFVPDPNSDKRIVASGWTNDELTRILRDFAKLYTLDDSFASWVKTGDSKAVVISFPNDIPPDLFFFLVNYLNYPNAYELSNRHLAIAGKATLTAAFDVPQPFLVGRSAKVYVPEGDKEFDLVYVTLPSGESYKISFTDHQWRRVPESLMPEAVRDL
ncbi:hypothetical protein [Peristeroidobacter soli]|jgi:hypothetical protein|uniref:hypothetical protein n=1 Tax=Peristeroidobacter soli TaxID=2497877 RepID=UPI00101BF0A3|nr:hypothetical protein [Peristeroidobacter soli]